MDNFLSHSDELFGMFGKIASSYWWNVKRMFLNNLIKSTVGKLGFATTVHTIWSSFGTFNLHSLSPSHSLLLCHPHSFHLCFSAPPKMVSETHLPSHRAQLLIFGDCTVMYSAWLVSYTCFNEVVLLSISQADKQRMQMEKDIQDKMKKAREDVSATVLPSSLAMRNGQWLSRQQTSHSTSQRFQRVSFG